MIPSTNRNATTLEEVRAFLRAERFAPPPWSPPQRSVEALYQLLEIRKHDRPFWKRLSDLLTRLEDRRFDPNAMASANFLRGMDTDRLIEDLRASLEGTDGAYRSLSEWLASSISVAALTGFLLLGVAIGCDDGRRDGDEYGSDSDVDGDSDSDTDADDPCPEAIDAEIPEPEIETYCDLVYIIKTSGLSTAEIEDVLECLPELDADYREQLLSMFQSMSNEELVDALQSMLHVGGVCYVDETDSH